MKIQEPYFLVPIGLDTIYINNKQGGHLMKKLFQLGNRYAEKSDWTDFALVKLCLGAMGVLIGINIPKEKSNRAGIHRDFDKED